MITDYYFSINVVDNGFTVDVYKHGDSGKRKRLIAVDAEDIGCLIQTVLDEAKDE